MTFWTPPSKFQIESNTNPFRSFTLQQMQQQQRLDEAKKVPSNLLKKFEKDIKNHTDYEMAGTDDPADKKEIKSDEMDLRRIRSEIAKGNVSKAFDLYDRLDSALQDVMPVELMRWMEDTLGESTIKEDHLVDQGYEYLGKDKKFGRSFYTKGGQLFVSVNKGRPQNLGSVEVKSNQKMMKGLVKEEKGGFKVGDTVHLGHGTKGGSGVVGKIIKIQGNMVHIKNDKGDTFKGPMDRVSMKEATLTPSQERDAQRRLKPTRATVAKVKLPATEKDIKKSVKAYQDAKGGNPGNTKKRRIRDLRLRDHVELEEAHAKDIVKGLSDADGPFTVVAIRNKKVIRQETTKMRNMLPAIVKTMRKDIGPGGIIAIEDKKGTIRNTFRESVELDEVAVGPDLKNILTTTKPSEYTFSAPAAKGKGTFAVIPVRKPSGQVGVMMATFDTKGSTRKLVDYHGTHRTTDSAKQFAKKEGLIESVQLDEWWEDQVNPRSKGWKNGVLVTNIQSYNSAGETMRLKKGDDIFYHPYDMKGSGGRNYKLVIAATDRRRPGTYFAINPKHLGLKGYDNATGPANESVEQVVEKFDFEFPNKEKARLFMHQVTRNRLGSATGYQDVKVTVMGPNQAGVGSPTTAHKQMAKIMKKLGGKLLRTDEGPRMRKVFMEDVEQVDERRETPFGMPSLPGVGKKAKFTSAQIDKLRDAYGKIGRVDPSSDSYKNLTSYLDSLPLQVLKQLATAKIKFISGLALNRAIKQDSNFSLMGKGKK